MSPWKVILATITIFGSGVVTGGLLVKNLTTSLHRHGSGYSHSAVAKNAAAPAWQLQRVEFVRKMEKQLNLTPEQHKHIEKIMHDSQERTKPLWEKIAPQMQIELRRVREAIRSELDPEQQKKFEELLKVHPPRKADESQSEERRRRKESASKTSVSQAHSNQTESVLPSDSR